MHVRKDYCRAEALAIEPGTLAKTCNLPYSIHENHVLHGLAGEAAPGGAEFANSEHSSLLYSS